MTRAPDDSWIDLYRRFCRGDRGAFAEIVARHQAEAFRLALLWTGDRQHAEDLVQEALWKAWRRHARLRQPETFPAWFLRILVNAHRDWWRRERRVREHCAPLPRGESPAWATPAGDEAPTAAADRADDLRRALLQLPPDDRLALVLRYYRGLPVKEVAAVLDRPVNTVVSRIHRSLARLRALLTREELGGEHLGTRP